jgi:Rrf2 family nitric oxide-sensitive transcriptional repressor
MFSRTTEYALRAVVYLADSDGDPCTGAQISEATQVPPDYLSKVMRELGRAKLVHSRRGFNGGFTLARDPAEITVLQVVNAVDPIERITTCPLGIKGHGKLCPLHRSLDEAIALVEKAFASTTIADLVAGPRKRNRCRFPVSELQTM